MLVIPECCICGKEKKDLVKISIEDSIVEVCDNCSSYGKIVPSKTKQTKFYVKLKEENEFELIENFGQVIKKARENLGVQRKDFAEKIKKSEKLIKKIESGDIKPDFELIRIIEKELNIKLVENIEKNFQKKEYKKAELTIGDVVQID